MTITKCGCRVNPPGAAADVFTITTKWHSKRTEIQWSVHWLDLSLVHVWRYIII